LKGTPAIHRDGRLIQVIWNTRAGASFTRYSNGQWNRERDNGDNLAEHPTPLTQNKKSGVNRSAKLYWPASGFAAWWEWVTLKSRQP
jgi:hypothetical protein